MRQNRKIQNNKPAGLTLIEIMITITIIGIVGGGSALFLMGYLSDAKVESAKERANVIRQAAELYLATENECPSVQDLVDDGKLDKTKDNNDPWGNEYSIECDGPNVTVTSEGLEEAKKEEEGE